MTETKIERKKEGKRDRGVVSRTPRISWKFYGKGARKEGREKSGEKIFLSCGLIIDDMICCLIWPQLFSSWRDGLGSFGGIVTFWN